MTPLVKQLAIVIVALIGLLDAHWGTQFLGALTTEVVTVIVTLVLAALGFVEIRSHQQAQAHSPAGPL